MDCFAPAETIICEGLYFKLLSLESFSQMASFKSGAPAVGVYLLQPSLIALIAAFFTFSGISKSGSPAPKPITSTPCAASCFAFAVMASVADVFTSLAILDNVIYQYLLLKDHDSLSVSQ